MIASVYFSWFNRTEVSKVVMYVNYLLRGGCNGKRISEDDIGIISPYKRQVGVILIDILSVFIFMLMGIIFILVPKD